MIYEHYLSLGRVFLSFFLLLSCVFINAWVFVARSRSIFFALLALVGWLNIYIYFFEPVAHTYQVHDVEVSDLVNLFSTTGIVNSCTYGAVAAKYCLP